MDHHAMRLARESSRTTGAAFERLTGIEQSLANVKQWLHEETNDLLDRMANSAEVTI